LILFFIFYLHIALFVGPFFIFLLAMSTL